MQDEVPRRPDILHVLQALRPVQPVEDCKEKEEGEMRGFFGLLIFGSGLIGLALVWPVLWFFYAILFGAFLIGGRD